MVSNSLADIRENPHFQGFMPLRAAISANIIDFIFTKLGGKWFII